MTRKHDFETNIGFPDHLLLGPRHPLTFAAVVRLADLFGVFAWLGFFGPLADFFGGLLGESNIEFLSFW